MPDKDTDRRGELVQRVGVRSQRPTTKVHYVDSTINDDAITYCGRRMADKTPKGKLEYFGGIVAAVAICQSCGEGALAEPS
jgi:hypothetical protein